MPRWHVTLARCPHNPCYHAINVNTPPMLARLPHKHAIHGTHDSPNSTSFIKLLAILGLKLQEQFLLLLLVFTAFTFQALLSIFIKVQKTTIEKLNFFRGNQSALFKRRLFFQKEMRNFFRKNCFLTLVSFWSFYYTTIVYQNELPLLSILNERKSSIFRNSRP